MGLFDFFRSKTEPREDLVVWHEIRAAEPDINIFSPSLSLTSSYGVQDDDAPTVDQQRVAFRGLIFRMVTQRSRAIAKAMLKAQVSRQVSDDEYEPVEDGHPWKALLRNPSPNSDPFTFWKSTSQLRDMGRGAFHYVARGARGVPDCFYTIYPEFGDVYPQGNTTGGIAGFRFYPSGGTFLDLMPEDIVWLRHQHPVSPYESASLIEAAAFQADKDLYMQIYGRDMMKDGQVPPLYMSTAENLTQTQVDTYRKQFKEKHRTLGSQGNIPVLPNGGKLELLSIKPDDMQYVEASGMNSKELMWIFGFSPSMFEDGGVVANSRELRRAWYQDSIQPEIDELCSNITRQLHRIYGTVDDTLCVKAPNVVPADPMEDARLYELEIRSGTRKPGDIIAMRGEDVPAELDQYFMTGGLRPVIQPEPQNEPMPTL